MLCNLNVHFRFHKNLQLVQIVESDDSNPHCQILLLKIDFNIILQFLPYIMLVVFFFHVFLPELYTYLCSAFRTWILQFINFDLITLILFDIEYKL
jgi:hypothetical protein